MATDPASGTPPLVAGTTQPTSDERNLAVLCHVGGFLTWFVLPLILWLVKRDQSKFLDDQCKEALNFQFSIGIYTLVAVLSILLVVGILLVPALIIFEIVVIIQAAIAANKGERYRYPLCIRFVK